MAKKKDGFCIFITTHGRPDRQRTYDTLIDCGYTGELFLVVDDQDKSKSAYKKLYGKQVKVFKKSDYYDSVDACDNLQDYRAVVYARHACYDLAKKLGYEYFIQVDDDYTAFNFMFDGLARADHILISDLDTVLARVFEYYKSIPAKAMALGQGGDYIGGYDSSNLKAIKSGRKLMNTFFMSTSRPLPFVGRMNDDVNTYVNSAMRGELLITLFQLAITQITTQSSAGGMSETFVNEGTYVKSFYSVMNQPSCVRIGTIGTTQRRLHHKIRWANAMPKIIPEKYRKPRPDLT